MEITLSKRHIAIVVLIVAGICFFCHGMAEYYHMKTAISLEYLKTEDLEKGMCVKGVVTEYAGFTPEGFGKESFMGVSTTFLSGGKELDFYTVRLKDDRYITLMVSDRETKKKLEGYHKGIGKDAYIEGVITTPLTELNYKWLQDALKVNSNEEVIKLVSPLYAIEKTDFEKKGMGMRYGIGCFLTASVLFIAGYRVNRKKTEEKE